jgi:hypothetical protein
VHSPKEPESCFLPVVRSDHDRSAQCWASPRSCRIDKEPQPVDSSSALFHLTLLLHALPRASPTSVTVTRSPLALPGPTSCRSAPHTNAPAIDTRTDCIVSYRIGFSQLSPISYRLYLYRYAPLLEVPLETVTMVRSRGGSELRTPRARKGVET